MKTTTRKIVFSALLAALTCVLTTVTKIPTPFHGYVNMGDCVVLLCGFTLSPFYAFLAAGIGSALADLISGYAIYIPATFIIKGLVAVAAYYLYKLCRKKFKTTLSAIISAIPAEVVMVLGYFVFEAILYGAVPSLVNIPPNALQGAFGVFGGVILFKIVEKVNIK